MTGPAGLVKLSAQQLEDVRAKNVSNILKKLSAGKTITAREDRILEESRAGNKPGAADGNYAPNLTELGRRVNRSRQTLAKWAKEKDFPRPRADDNRYEVAAVLKWMVAKGKSDTTVESSSEPEAGSKAFWDRERSRLDFLRADYEFRIRQDKFVPIEEITAAIGQMLAGFRTALNMLPGTAARWLIGLKDFHAIKHKLQSEVDAVLQALGRRRYLEELAPAVIEKMFSDRAPDFRETLARSCEAVFRELGQQALSDLLQREIESAETSAATGAPEQKAGAASTEAAPGIPLQPSTSKSRAQTRPRK